MIIREKYLKRIRPFYDSDLIKIINGNKKYYIQVAYSVAADDAYSRKMAPFNLIKDNLSKKILITNEDLDYSTSLVQHIKFKDFLWLEDLN